jgi:cell division protease FtsH
MGGRIAEEITFSQKTTGAGNDIEVATNLARSMVCEWGMSELGPLAFGRKEGEVFLGREMTTTQAYSEQTARDIDAEVRRIVTEQYERAKAVLLEQRTILNRIADALIEYETLDASDIDVLMAGGAISRAPPVKPASVPPQEKGKRGGLLDAVGGMPAASKA